MAGDIVEVESDSGSEGSNAEVVQCKPFSTATQNVTSAQRYTETLGRQGYNVVALQETKLSDVSGPVWVREMRRLHRRVVPGASPSLDIRVNTTTNELTCSKPGVWRFFSLAVVA